jgi:hypothetical protein
LLRRWLRNSQRDLEQMRMQVGGFNGVVDGGHGEVRGGVGRWWIHVAAKQQKWIASCLAMTGFFRFALCLAITVFSRFALCFAMMVFLGSLRASK